jgi:hypothetical protein
MKVALRVLTALTERQVPDAADLERLHRCLSSYPPDAAPDELACDVIQQALKRRAIARTTGAS